MAFGGLGAAMAQRFCGNEQCHVFMWEPDKTLGELMLLRYGRVKAALKPGGFAGRLADFAAAG